MGYRDRWTPGETAQIIEDRTADFIAGRMSEIVYTASIFGLGKNRSKVDEIIWAAKVKKHQQKELSNERIKRTP